MATEKKPNDPSADYSAMKPFWDMVEAILGGAPAMRAACATYLPKFENESSDDYKLRCEQAPLTNIYGDISESLASKPFSKPIQLNEDAPDRIAGTINAGTKERSGGLVDDIDGQGNNLHVFAGDYFKAGIDKAIDWILVDFTKAKPNADNSPLTQAQEKEQGLRPYWVHVAAERLLAVHSAFVDGQEIIYHARLHDPETVIEGYEEKTKERVRIYERAAVYGVNNRITGFGPATWRLLEEQKAADGKVTWVQVDAGAVTIGVIPLVPFSTGKRIGSSFQFKPPLRDIAFMQIEEFQQESNLKSTKILTAFPMLVGEGVDLSETVPDPQNPNGPPVTRQRRVPVGPRSVLTTGVTQAGTFGTWKYIEIAATSLNFLKDDLGELRENMKELGKQPLISQTGDVTATATALAGSKAHSAAQKWALALKTSLELAFKYTLMWLGETEKTVTVTVHTDFAVDIDGGKDTDALLRAEGPKIFSKQTVRAEFKRRGVVSDSVDLTKEDELIAGEMEGLEGEVTIDPKTGKPIEPSAPPPNDPNKPPVKDAA
jgi:hypothetical protein